ncbi:hypothetical protein F5Y07DRAFT_357931 [Xylaria sp. FL0933]|nr:hypothetical protein F5Y07DRAFT_357931 [Xylaria sp. FL0933]
MYLGMRHDRGERAHGGIILLGALSSLLATRVHARWTTFSLTRCPMICDITPESASSCRHDIVIHRASDSVNIRC